MSKLREYFRLDLPWGTAQPRPLRFLIATAISVVGSVLACWVVASATIALVPSTAGYGHFEFIDYTRLTVIGVVAASAAWPVTTLLSSHARRLFFWLAAAVTIVSFAPDLWILRQGQPIAGVVALMVMHLALAGITYPVLVLLSPQKRGAATRLSLVDPVGAEGGRRD